MASVSVAEATPGLIIAKDVITPLGGTLLNKGRVLLPRDVEILQAFLIREIEIETANGAKTSEPRKTEAIPAKTKAAHEILPGGIFSTLHDAYDNMLALVKRSYQSAVAAPLPMLDLRSSLEGLLSLMKDYQVLKFTPRLMNEQDYNYHNAVLSAMTSYQLAQWCGYPQKEWMQIAFAGLLHDIGNTKVDAVLLQKPEPLSQTERDEVRQHTTYGYQLLRNVAAVNEGVRLAALQHHEKIDGSGYPLRLEGGKIHYYAKIVAVADIFHAMTLEKAYRKRQSPYLVLEELQKESFGKLDPFIVQTFIQKSTDLHNGTRIRLSNGSEGEIIFTDRSHPTRPMVRTDERVVNLVTETNLYIKEIIL